MHIRRREALVVVVCVALWVGGLVLGLVRNDAPLLFSFFVLGPIGGLISWIYGIRQRRALLRRAREADAEDALTDERNVDPTD